jgi:hypothetical protein
MPTLSKLLHNSSSISIRPTSNTKSSKKYKVPWEAPRLDQPSRYSWGTHTKAFQRIIENIEALRVWAQDPRIASEVKGSERAIGVGRTLSNVSFLPKLTELEAIIHPISDAIVEAQVDSAHLAHGRPRWTKLYTHLKLMDQASAESWDNLWPVLEARWCRQLLDIRDLAFWLLPANVHSRLRFCKGTLNFLIVRINQLICRRADTRTPEPRVLHTFRSLARCTQSLSLVLPTARALQRRG